MAGGRKVQPLMQQQSVVPSPGGLMVNIGKGIIAVFVASAALSGAVVLAAWTGLTLAFRPVEAVSGIMLTPAGLSWVVHFAIGTFL